MMHNRFSFSIAFLFAFVIGSSAFSTRAADHFLAIGGGDSPANNQISLEKNVLFFQRTLADCIGAGTGCDVLFSDGAAHTRDIQFLPDEDVPRLNVLMARLHGAEDSIYYRYRTHQIPGVSGPSSRRGLSEWFRDAGKKLGENDRLIIYFTGHGGAGAPEQNTTISIYNEPPMPVVEFTALLDLLSPKVKVALVMVQCHSGGFAGTIFKKAKAGGELSDARRCGFFATRFDRNAAGCTPDTQEDDYKDYSTYFLAALDGKSRTGKPVGKCDIDGDGHVSFAEAHLYAMLNSDTIDIPTTTSDALLRTFSKTSGGENLSTPQMAFKELLEKAPLLQKTALEGLSKQLNLVADDRFDETKKLAELLEAERKTVEQDRGKKRGEVDRLARNIRSRVTQAWPEISNPWHPRTAALMKDEGATIQKTIESDRDYARWDILNRDCEKLFDRGFGLERRWVKCQRLLRALETAALAENISKVAPPAIVERYEQMVEDEAGTLSPSAER